MSSEMIITISVFAVVILAFIGVLIYAFVKKGLKNDVIAWCKEAEETGKSGSEKLKYVIDKVKEKYHFNMFIKVANTIVELIIKISKDINYKK